MIQITFAPKAYSEQEKGADIETFDSSTTEDTNTYDYDIKSNTTYFVTFEYGDNNCIAGVDIHIYSEID